MTDEQEFLEPAEYVDSDSPDIIAYAKKAVGDETDPVKQAILLYNAVRDDIVYDPYLDYTTPETYRASSVLKLGRGFCVGKAALLAACARVLGIPARPGFADVRNHVTSPKLYELTQDDKFYWHAFVEMKLNGRWVKSTPAFDIELCQRAHMAPLEFDGETDSLFQPFDESGRKRMEYLRMRGTYADVPTQEIMDEFKNAYPALYEANITGHDFAAEAVAGDTRPVAE